MALIDEPIAIKRYASRRLHQSGTGTYVTLETLAEIVEDDEDFVVFDAETGADITRSVLKQIILERARHD
jgi:polyhydroxyalkanoate synthesis repressor PhaR